MADLATDRIRLRIVSGELGLGEGLSEASLAAELGISKTPVREALLRLREEGLVDIQPQRGTFVFQISGEEAHVLSAFRDLLEAAALRAAMRHDAAGLAAALKLILADMKVAVAEGDARRYRASDDVFHRCIVEHGRNPYLASAYGTIAIRVQALRNRLSRESDLNYLSFKEHREIVGLVDRRQTAKAVAALRRHIARTPEDYARRLTSVGQI